GTGGASVSRRQAALGLQQGPVPRVGEEHCSCFCCVRAGEPVPGQKGTPRSRGVVSPGAAKSPLKGAGTGEMHPLPPLLWPFTHLPSVQDQSARPCSEVP